MLLIGLACVTGLVVGAGIFIATGDGDPDESIASNQPAPSAPAERVPSSGNDERQASSTSLTPAAMVERAERIMDSDPAGARGLLQQAEADGDGAVSTRAATLLGELNYREKQKRIAEKTAEGEADQAEWEAGEGDRETAKKEREAIAAQVRLLDAVKHAGTRAQVAKSAAALKEVETILDAATRDPACDEQVQYAVDDARELVLATRKRLQTSLRDEANALASAKKFDAALAKLADLRTLFGGPPPTAIAQLEREWTDARAAHLAQVKAEQKAAQDEAQAKAGAAAEEKAAASAKNDREREKITKEITKRAKAWFKARQVKTLRCKDCKGELIVRCKPCKGREVIACRQCGGAGSIIVFGQGRGLTSRGGRGRRVKKNCPRCNADKTEDCPKCTDGTNVCECKQSRRGALAGYRLLAVKRAFWEYVGPDARSGWKKDDYVAEVGRGKALRGQVGRTLDLHRASVEGVQVLADRVVVTARVQWNLTDEEIADGVPDEEVVKSTWIRSKGKFYLRTKADTQPETLLE